jgi:hypothetical protein
MTITLSEMEEIILLETGEYLLENIENLSLDAAKLWILAKRVLKFYNSKRPFTYKQNLTISGGSYTYTSGVDYGPPIWISSVVPVTSSNVMDVYSQLSNRTIGEVSLLEIPRSFVWKYEDPKLYCGEDGRMDVVEVHDHQYELTTDSTGKVTEVIFTTLNQRDDSLFFELLEARFLMMLGRSRRAFTMNDLPIVMDASELVSEGQEIWRDTNEKLEEVDKWWLALGEGTGV